MRALRIHFPVDKVAGVALPLWLSPAVLVACIPEFGTAHSTTPLWGTCVLWCPGVWAGWGQPWVHRNVPGDAHHLLFQDRGSQPQLGSDPPRQPIRSQHLLSLHPERQTGALQASPGGWEAVGSPLTWVGSHPQVGDAMPDTTKA